MKWPWSAKDEPRVAAWLQKNEVPMAVAAQAARRPHFFNPIVPERTADGTSKGLISATLPITQALREVARVLITRAMLRLKEGKHADAWGDIMTCRRLGRLQSRGASVLIEALVGLALENMASQALNVFLSHVPADAARHLEQWQADWEAVPPAATLGDRCIEGERFNYLDSVRMMHQFGPDILNRIGSGSPMPTSPPKWYEQFFTWGVNWDPVLRQGNEFFDRWTAIHAGTDRAERVRDSDAVVAELKFDSANRGMDFVTSYVRGPTFRGELLGRILIRLLAPAVFKVQDAVDRAEQAEHNVRIAFALARFKREQGKYPPKLDALAPKYLGVIPNDVFSGMPPRYQPNEAGYLLYSVGQNGRDDGGQTHGEGLDRDDLRMRMPADPPKPREVNR